MKRFKITIGNLIVLFIIVLLVMSIFIYSLNRVKRHQEVEKFVSDMEYLQDSVNKIINEYQIWEEYNINEAGNYLEYIQSFGYSNANAAVNIYIKEFNEILNDLNSQNLEYWNTNSDSILSNYFYFSPKTLKSNFNIDNSNLNVIINFYTGNIIAKDGIKDVDGKIIYRQYDSVLGNKLMSPSISNNLKTAIEVIENNGLSQRVKVYFSEVEDGPSISEVYYYYNDNETKRKCSELQDYIYMRDENTAYFTLNETGKYYFFIKDINFKEYMGDELDVKLVNKPVLVEGMTGIYWDEEGNEKTIDLENNPNWYDYSLKNLKFANAKTEDGNYWVWIPRFQYRVTDEETLVEYSFELTERTTQNKKPKDYKIHEGFESNELGFWIAKFQVNGEKNISIKPSQTLTLISVKNAIRNLNDYKNSSLMSEEERKAIIILADYGKKEISNDLVHYSGGGVNKEDYIQNVRYSSTGNVYGVYDLITSENERVKNNSEQEVGRYRPIIKIKN